MAKRFTATEKWDDPWYRKLPCEYRDFWQYILDKCDNAGIWVKDMDTARHYIGANIDENKAIELFNGGKDRIKIHSGGSKWEVIDFIEFQFGFLKDTNPLHMSILNLIDKHLSRGIAGVFKGYQNPISKGKGKGKGKGIYKKRVVKGERFLIPTLKDVSDYCSERHNNIDPVAFIDFYTSKDWMIGKNRMKDWMAAVRTWENSRKEEFKQKPTQAQINSIASMARLNERMKIENEECGV